jgi:hypothetical protein
VPLVRLAMPLLLVSRLLAPAGYLHFDYIREVGIMEGLIQIFLRRLTEQVWGFPRRPSLG